MASNWSLLSVACAVALLGGCGDKPGGKSEALNPVKVADPGTEGGGERVAANKPGSHPSSINPGSHPSSANPSSSNARDPKSAGPNGSATNKAPAPNGANPKVSGKGATSTEDAPELASAAVVSEEDAASVELGREHFGYSGGVRDPFASLLEGEGTGPELADLQLVAIYHDNRFPSRSVAVFRGKINNKMYRARPGERLGRMRVSAIRVKDVTFAINDFGTIRLATLSLRKREEKNK